MLVYKHTPACLQPHSMACMPSSRNLFNKDYRHRTCHRHRQEPRCRAFEEEKQVVKEVVKEEVVTSQPASFVERARSFVETVAKYRCGSLLPEIRLPHKCLGQVVWHACCHAQNDLHSTLPCHKLAGF